MRRATIAAVLLVGCIPAEEGIDDTRIRGTVRLEPLVINETAIRNEQNRAAETADETSRDNAFRLYNGSIDGWGINETDGDLLPASDQDWHVFIDPGADPPDAIVTNPETGEAFYVADEDEAVTFTLTISSDTAVVRFELFDLDDASGPFGEPTKLWSQDVSGEATLTHGMRAGNRYGLRLAGVEGTGSVDYQLVFPGYDPNESRFLVGAFLSADIDQRGDPVAGSNVLSFEPLPAPDQWTFEGEYEMFLVRSVTTEIRNEGTDKEQSITKVDEQVGKAYLYAGDWPKLQAFMPAGTYHSAEPIEVDIQSAEPEEFDEKPEAGAAEGPLLVAETVVVDALAPIVIGQEFTEVEPNDMFVDINSFELDVSNPEAANDIDTLSGPGFVDIFRGNIDILSAAEDWVHDNDAFKFRVPDDEQIFMSLDWDDGNADLDVIIHDEEGTPLDWAASFDKPDVEGGYWDFEPDLVYYLVVVGYLGDEGTSPAYELRIEQVGLR